MMDQAEVTKIGETAAALAQVDPVTARVDMLNTLAAMDGVDFSSPAVQAAMKRSVITHYRDPDEGNYHAQYRWASPLKHPLPETYETGRIFKHRIEAGTLRHVVKLGFATQDGELGLNVGLATFFHTGTHGGADSGYFRSVNHWLPFSALETMREHSDPSAFAMVDAAASQLRSELDQTLKSAQPPRDAS